MEWRKAWEATWDSRRYCSERCRRRRLRPEDTALEMLIVELLHARAHGATICPSEVARQVDAHAWRELMELTRSAARRLAARGTVEILQGGRTVDPSVARGPIRLRLARRSPPRPTEHAEP